MSEGRGESKHRSRSRRGRSRRGGGPKDRPEGGRAEGSREAEERRGPQRGENRDRPRRDASGTPPVLTLLPPPGQPAEVPLHEHLEIEAGTLRDWFRWVLLARGLDEQCQRWHRSGRLPFYVPSAGNEIVDLGSAMAARPDDWMFPSFRHLGLALLRGASAREVLDAALGNANDPGRGRPLPAQAGDRRRNIVPASTALATHLVHAAGCALGMQVRGEKHIAIAFCGPGAAAAPDFYTALEIARLRRAPVVFVVAQGRGVAPASPTLAARAKAHGVAAARVDGTDLFAMVKASRDASAHARRGAGPSLIEAVRPKPSRSGGNGHSEDPALDPIERFRSYAIDVGLADTAAVEALEREVAEELQDAAQRALETPPPEPESRFDDVWLHEPDSLVEQRRLDLETSP